jgi:mycothiol synthase
VSSAPDASVATANTLSAAERRQVEGIDRAAAQADGVAALDDQVRLDLQYDDDAVLHLLRRGSRGDTVIGYAHLRFPAETGSMTAVTAEHAPRDAPPPAPPIGHLVVDPAFRRAGHGAALLAGMLETAPGGLRVWAHGDLPAAGHLATRAGMHRARELWRLRRDLGSPLPDPTYPPDVTVRQFVVGRDEAAWLAVNAVSFADHPEQGNVSADGLAQRMAQPEFDPAGFFLAERGGEVVGFHWTKAHPAGELGPEAVGEVYVLGVHPAAQGLGLGKALTLTGLRHLQSRGLGDVILYVEADNTAAVALYSRLGFARAAVDVVYATPLQPAP